MVETNTYMESRSTWQVRVDGSSRVPGVEVRRLRETVYGVIDVRDCTGVINPADAAQAVLHERPSQSGWRTVTRDVAQRWDGVLWEAEEHCLRALSGNGNAHTTTAGMTR